MVPKGGFEPPRISPPPLKMACLPVPPRRCIPMITLPSCMASHTGTTSQKFAFTSEGVIYSMVDNAAEGGRLTVQ